MACGGLHQAAGHTHTTLAYVAGGTVQNTGPPGLSRAWRLGAQTELGAFELAVSCCWWPVLGAASTNSTMMVEQPPTAEGPSDPGSRRASKQATCIPSRLQPLFTRPHQCVGCEALTLRCVANTAHDRLWVAAAAVVFCCVCCVQAVCRAILPPTWASEHQQQSGMARLQHTRGSIHCSSGCTCWPSVDIRGRWVRGCGGRAGTWCGLDACRGCPCCCS